MGRLNGIRARDKRGPGLMTLVSQKGQAEGRSGKFLKPTPSASMRQAPKEPRSTNPACCLATLPFSNAIKVGMPRMPKRAAIAGSSSTLTLAKRARGSSSFAALSKIGAIVRHGPHHGAQKSTISGMSLRSTCLSKVFAVSTIGSPVNRFALQAPHVASEAGRLAGTRLTAEQWGQTTWLGSVMGRALSIALANIWPQSAPFQAVKYLRLPD